MEEIYLSYIPKVAGEEEKDFKLIEVLKRYVLLYPNHSNMISAPGYMSYEKNAGIFVEKFEQIVSDGKPRYLGYFKNTEKQEYVSKNGYTKIINEHYSKFTKNAIFKKISINLSDKNDHRKMIFFFNIKDNPPFNFDINKLNRETKDNFINSIVVNAVLMGSSNQSFQTYFGGKEGIADKGEADILMFVSEIPVNSNSMHVNGTITFKALDGIPSSPREYLKQILIDYLDVAIK